MKRRASKRKTLLIDLKETVKTAYHDNNKLEMACHILKKASGLEMPDSAAFNTKVMKFEQYETLAPEELEKKLSELNLERESLTQEYARLQKTCGLIGKQSSEKFQFIINNLNSLNYPLLVFLKALKMPSSSYYSIITSEQAQRKKDLEFKDILHEICPDKNQIYRVAEVSKQLRAKNQAGDKGYSFTHKSLKARMEKLGIKVSVPPLRSPESVPLTKKDKDTPLKITMPTTLEWDVPSGGYIWGDGELVEFQKEYHKDFPETMCSLIPKRRLAQPEEGGDKTYFPLKDNALFAKFADLDSTKESFLQWANNYGPLFLSGEEFNGKRLTVSLTQIDQSTQTMDRDEVSSIEYNDLPTELYNTWVKEHRELKRAVHVWELWDDSLWNRDRNGAESLKILSEMLSWTYEDVLVVRVFHEEEEKEKANWKESDFTKYLRDIMADADRYSGFCFQLASDTETPSTTTIASVWLRGKIRQKVHEYPLPLRVELEQDNQIKGIIHPKNLLTIMWYQLLRVVRLSGATQGKAKGRIPLRRCALCKKWTSLRGRHDEDSYGEHGNWKRHEKCLTGVPVPKYLPRGKIRLV